MKATKHNGAMAALCLSVELDTGGDMSYEVWGEPDDIPECRSCEEAAKDYEELEKVVGDLAQRTFRIAIA